jgi:GNAT superfamily N-acetyltransferase
VEARQATAADARTVGETLGKAFVDDPVWRWMTGDRAPQAVAALTSTWCSWHPSEFTVVDGAASWWHPPGEWRMSFAQTLRLVPHVAPAARLGSLRLLRMSMAIERQHPAEPAAYLAFLGASIQGRGLGRTVMQPALDVCDAFGWPAYLESSNPQNLPFYRRLGFVDRPALKVPRGCPPITPMWRDPR